MSAHNILFSIRKRKTPKIISNLLLWDFFNEYEFETAVVNELAISVRATEVLLQIIDAYSEDPN